MLPPDASYPDYPPLLVKGGPDIHPGSHAAAVADVGLFALSKGMEKILDVEVAGIESPMKRLEALLDVVDRHSLFDKTDDSHWTSLPSEVFESGSGNCLSYSLAFAAMARHVGLSATFQDVPTYPHWDRHGKLLFFNRHVSVRVDAGALLKYDIDFHPDGGLPNRDTSQEGRQISDNEILSLYYNNIGSEHFASGNLPMAFRYFAKAIKTDPGLSYMWSNLGAVYKRNQQPGAAERAFRQAIAINRREYTAMSNLVRLYESQGNEKKAELYASKAKSFRNKNPYYHFSIGTRAFEEGRYKKSVKHLKRAIYRKAEVHYFHYALALAYLKLGKAKRAERSMEKAQSYSPNRITSDYYNGMWLQLSQEQIPDN